MSGLINTRQYKGFHRGEKVKLTHYVESSFSNGYAGDIFYITGIRIYEENHNQVFFILSRPWELRKNFRMDDVYVRLGAFEKVKEATTK